MIAFLIALAATALAALLAAALDARLSVRTYSFASRKLASPVRLALVADLHCTGYGAAQEKLLAALSAAAPDALVIAGDTFDEDLPPDNALALLRAAAGAYPCYCVFGNHEFLHDDPAALKDTVRALGVTVLEGDSALLTLRGQTLLLCGVDDPARFGGYVRRRGYPLDAQWEAQLAACAAAAQGSERFSILLSHRPELAPRYRGQGFDLVLAGHAHGGQVRLPGLPNGLFAPCQGMFPQYTGGRYELDDTTLLVSRGLCRNIVPRVLNRPELVLIDILPEA